MYLFFLSQEYQKISEEKTTTYLEDRRNMEEQYIKRIEGLTKEKCELEDELKINQDVLKKNTRDMLEGKRDASIKERGYTEIMEQLRSENLK